MKKREIKKSVEGMIEDLAAMTANGFSDINSKFEKVEKRLGDLEDGQKNLEEGQKKIRHDIQELGDRYVSKFNFEQLSIRVSKLEEKRSGKK